MARVRQYYLLGLMILLTVACKKWSEEDIHPDYFSDTAWQSSGSYRVQGQDDTYYAYRLSLHHDGSYQLGVVNKLGFVKDVDEVGTYKTKWENGKPIGVHFTRKFPNGQTIEKYAIFSPQDDALKLLRRTYRRLR